MNWTILLTPILMLLPESKRMGLFVRVVIASCYDSKQEIRQSYTVFRIVRFNNALWIDFHDDEIVRNLRSSEHARLSRPRMKWVRWNTLKYSLFIVGNFIMNLKYLENLIWWHKELIYYEYSMHSPWPCEIARSSHSMSKSVWCGLNASS